MKKIIQTPHYSTASYDIFLFSNCNKVNNLKLPWVGKGFSKDAISRETKRQLNLIIKSVTPGLLILLLAVTFSACKKNTNQAPENQPSNPATGCKITQFSTIGIANVRNSYSFEYDASGNISKITQLSGALNRTEIVHPDYVQFFEGTSTVEFIGIRYDSKYLEKLPSSFYTTSGTPQVQLAGFYTYDNKSRILTAQGGIAENGKPVVATATTITFVYDANNNVTDITYNYQNSFRRSFNATGFDNHVSAYNNVKNSWFLQLDFELFATELDNPRFLFDHLSAHNVLGYVDHENYTTSLFTETYTYTYDDKGRPIERQAAQGYLGGPLQGGNHDSWVYDCK